MTEENSFLTTERFVKEGTWPRSMRLTDDLGVMFLNKIMSLDAGEIEMGVVPTGLGTLDRVLSGGFHAGHVIVLAGSPGMGKTSLAHQIAANIAEADHSVIFFSLKMTGLEVMERAICRDAGLSVPHMKMITLQSNDFSLLTDALNTFVKLPLLIDDASFDVCTLIENSKTTAAGLAALSLPPLGAIFVDYLQLIGSKATNEPQKVSQIVAALKRLARELKVAVVVLSQLNQTLEIRSDMRPRMSDLRESGSIEEHVDIVLFLYREEYYSPRSKNKGVAEIIVAKNRYGAITNSRLIFIGERFQFRDISHK